MVAIRGLAATNLKASWAATTPVLATLAAPAVVTADPRALAAATMTAKTVAPTANKEDKVVEIPGIKSTTQLKAALVQTTVAVTLVVVEASNINLLPHNNSCWLSW